MFDSWWHHYRFGNKKSLELQKFKGFFILSVSLLPYHITDEKIQGSIQTRADINPTSFLK